MAAEVVELSRQSWGVDNDATSRAMTFLATGARRHLYAAALSIPVAVAFDVLDGRVAGWRHEASALGARWIRSRM